MHDAAKAHCGRTCGIGGRCDVVADITRRYPIPIICVTAYADEKARARALRGGAVSFLAKPFSEDALLEAVQSAINVETEN